MILAIFLICLVSLTPLPTLPMVIYYYSKFGLIDGFVVVTIASNLKILIHCFEVNICVTINKVIYYFNNIDIFLRLTFRAKRGNFFYIYCFLRSTFRAKCGENLNLLVHKAQRQFWTFCAQAARENFEHFAPKASEKILNI